MTSALGVPLSFSIVRGKRRGNGKRWKHSFLVGGHAATRVGEAKRPGLEGVVLYVLSLFWFPLLDANIKPDTRNRYAAAVWGFLVFVGDLGDTIESPADLDYFMG